VLDTVYGGRGWLGLILGTRLWYPMYGLEDADDAVFEAKLDPIVKEIGEREGQSLPCSSSDTSSSSGSSTSSSSSIGSGSGSGSVPSR
jgi:hypothetical protein